MNNVLPHKYLDYYGFSGRTIGKGSSGQIYHCNNKNTELVIKSGYTNEDDSCNTSFIKEIVILHALSHPNIIKIIDVCYDKHYNINIVFPFCDKRDLEYTIKRGLNNLERYNIARDIASALKYIHSKYILHRDIKPPNILISNKNNSFHAYLADFGSSINLSSYNDKCRGDYCTLSYMAPEILSEQTYSFPSDIWSLAVTYYELFAGNKLFDCVDSTKENLLILIEQTIHKPDLLSMSLYNFPPVLLLIQQMLIINPNNRIKASELHTSSLWPKNVTPQSNSKIDESEENYQIISNYITNKNKKIIINTRVWLFSIAEDYNLEECNIYLALDLMNEYMNINMIDNCQIQLLGGVCIHLATLFCCENFSIQDCVYSCDGLYNLEECKQLRMNVLKLLNYNILKSRIDNILEKISINVVERFIFSILYVTYCDKNNILEIYQTSKSIADVYTNISNIIPPIDNNYLYNAYKILSEENINIINSYYKNK